MRPVLFCAYAVAFMVQCMQIQCEIFVDCDSLRTSLNQRLTRNSCGCTVTPKCNACADLGSVQVASCVGGCAYCDQSQTNCVTPHQTLTQASGRTFYTYSVFTTWNYTKGRSGSVYYSYSDGTSGNYDNCLVQVNGRNCSSCKMVDCEGKPIRREPNIDCTNLEAGATATACSRPYIEADVSLDESALYGILAPMAYPHILCQRGVTVLGTGPASPPSGAAPAGAPSNATPNTNKDCGLFKLNIFCLRGCGLIRRFLGFCSNE
jgi:hypothetical protein